MRIQIINEIKIAVADSIEDFASYCEGAPMRAETAKWHGEGKVGCLAHIRTGSEAHVRKTEPFMTELESVLPVSSATRIRAAISGGAPNVGAYLAGSPMAMRRRERVQSASEPLAIVIDVTSSGAIKSKDVERRGAAALALARCLGAARPVSVWYCAAARADGKNAATLVPLPQPLDLARAAYLLTDISAARNAGYASVRKTIGSANESLHWCYRDVNKYRQRAPEIFSQAIGGGTDVLFLAPMFLHDDQITDPAGFVKSKLAEYGGLELEDAA